MELKDDQPVYVTIPVTFTDDYAAAVTFTNIPKAYRNEGIDYKISPETVSVTLVTGEEQVPENGELTVGSIDFSELNNTLNTFTFSSEDLPYSLGETVKTFTVSVDLSDMHKRWLEIGVSTDDVKLPEGAELITETISSVQVIGPAESVDAIGNTEAYAIPQLDGIQLEKGVNVVPVKIILRTLTDSWVRGEYTAEIRVED